MQVACFPLPDFYSAPCIWSDPIGSRLCYASSDTDVCRKTTCPVKSVVGFVQPMCSRGVQHPSGAADWQGAAGQRTGKRFLLLTAPWKAETKSGVGKNLSVHVKMQQAEIKLCPLPEAGTGQF